MVMMRVWSMLQGAAEYGALTGGGAAASPRGPGGQSFAAWATDHQTALVAAAAGLLLLALVAASRR